MSPLHRREPGSESAEDLYASSDLCVSAPANRFPESGIEPRHAYTIVHDDLMLEGNPRLNLATFCTTWLEPETRALMDEALDKNIVDKDEYPQTAEIESRCIRMLADLWNAPGDGTPMGTSTTGSSEAAMLAGLAAKRRWRARGARPRASRPAAQHRVRPGAGVLGEVRALLRRRAARGAHEPAPRDCSPGTGASRAATRTPSPSSSRSARPSPACTRTSPRSAGALDDLEARTGISSADPRRRRQRRIPRPVHRAGAGLGLPAAARRSINASGHKTGLAPLGCGWVLWREAADLPEELIFDVNYLGGDYPTFNAQLLPPGRAGGRAVLRVPAARPRGLCPGARRLLRHRRADRRCGLGGRPASWSCTAPTGGAASPP